MIPDIRKIKHAWMPLTSITVWGLSFIATKMLLLYLSPLLIINLRLIFVIPFLLVTGFLAKKSFSIQKHQAIWILLLALISIVHLGIQVTGMQFTTASNTGWIIGTAPIFIAILSRFLLKEVLHPRAVFGIFVSLFGLLLLMSRGNFSSLSFGSGMGDLLVLTSCLTWAVFTLVNRKIALDCPPVTSSFYMFAFMAIIILPFNLNENSLQAAVSLPASGWLAVAFLGIFSSGVGYVLWAKALSLSGSVNTSVYLYIEPFVTLFGAWFFLGEQIPLIAIAAGLIIMLGVAIVNLA
ncbi:MAG: DMT family transporter [Ignavibacteriales bacterium]|nr:DMT family transporter [Ignavibacteriales bacterium]